MFDWYNTEDWIKFYSILSFIFIFGFIMGMCNAPTNKKDKESNIHNLVHKNDSDYDYNIICIENLKYIERVNYGDTALTPISINGISSTCGLK